MAPPASSPEPSNPFVETSELLRLSIPKRSVRSLLPIAGAILLALLVVIYVTATSASTSSEIAFAVLFFGSLLVIWVTVANVLAVRGLQAELARLETAEELIRLRRWQQAGMALQSMLVSPMRTQGTRAQALVLLARVFSRMKLYEDEMTVLDHLLQSVDLDTVSRHRVKLLRAQALLHEDRLVDADAAIAELRREVAGFTRALDAVRASVEGQATRSVDRAEAVEADHGDAASFSTRFVGTPAPSPELLLALVELHRDVKTGHSQEAIDGFRRHVAGWTQLLSHGVADAYALVACAYDHAGDLCEAQAMYLRATLLCPAGELVYRYDEVAGLAQRYTATEAPREVWA